MNKNQSQLQTRGLADGAQAAADPAFFDYHQSAGERLYTPKMFMNMVHLVKETALDAEIAYQEMAAIVQSERPDEFWQTALDQLCSLLSSGRYHVQIRCVEQRFYRTR